MVCAQSRRDDPLETPANLNKAFRKEYWDPDIAKACETDVYGYDAYAGCCFTEERIAEVAQTIQNQRKQAGLGDKASIHVLEAHFFKQLIRTE